MRRGPVAIVGAGVSGLTIARELVRAGFDVTVVEREAAVGGLARTFRYGDRFFDVGPHRFHTEDARTHAWLLGAIGAEAHPIRRSSAVHAFGGLHEWPLRRRVLLGLPPRLLFRAGLDLLRRARAGGESFEAEMTARYGATLYGAFFEPYTRRFVGMDPGRLDADWGRAGIDRAVIDRRHRASGLRDLLRGLVLPEPSDTTFLYPERGIGRLAERLADDVVAAGGRLLLGAAVERLETGGDRVEALVAGRERLEVETVVWSGPLTTACRLLRLDERGLRFRSTLLFNVSLRGPPRVERQWIYFGGESSFVRVSMPQAFSKAAAPEGRGSVCVERTCDEGDRDWDGADALVPEVIAALVRHGVVGHARDAQEVRVERVADTYPVYTLGYRRARAACLADLSRYRNLLAVGRCGRFWYNNMDHAIGQGLAVAAQLAAGQSPDGVDVGALDFWSAQRPGARSSAASGR